jgi:hypothetical protein
MIAQPKVGSVVKVTTRYPESYLYAKNKFRDVTTVGKVVENDRWTPVGNFSITTGRPEYPIAIIALHNVIKVETAGKVVRASVEKSAPKVWKVTSKRSGEVYTVTNNAGSWSCTCVGYQYHRKCKHILEKRGK